MTTAAKSGDWVGSAKSLTLATVARALGAKHHHRVRKTRPGSGADSQCACASYQSASGWQLCQINDDGGYQDRWVHCRQLHLNGRFDPSLSDLYHRYEKSSSLDSSKSIQKNIHKDHGQNYYLV